MFDTFDFTGDGPNNVLLVCSGVKRDVDHLDSELAECQGQLAYVEDDLAQSQDDLEEARSQQTVPDGNAEAQRVHEMEILDKKLRVEELRLTTAQLEAENLKAQPEEAQTCPGEGPTQRSIC